MTGIRMEYRLIIEKYEILILGWPEFYRVYGLFNFFILSHFIFLP